VKRELSYNECKFSSGVDRSGGLPCRSGTSAS